MDFRQPLALDPVPDGWRHRTFFRTDPMQISFVSKEGRNAYSATKSALIGLAKASALDLGSFGITVNCLCPGPFLTDLPGVAHVLFSLPAADEVRHLVHEVRLGLRIRQFVEPPLGYRELLTVGQIGVGKGSVCSARTAGSRRVEQSGQGGRRGELA